VGRRRRRTADHPGLTEVEATHAFGDRIRAAFVLGENPAVTEPNATRVADALDALDCLVVQDIFLTETAEHADVVLPGSAWAERGGTVTNTDRQVIRMRPNAAPPGEARRYLDVLCDLGRRLTDVSDAFDYDGPEAVFEELTTVAPQYAGMSYEGIGTDSQRWPYPADADSGTAVLHESAFASGDRRAPLRIVEHVDPVDAVGDDDLVLTTGRVVEHFNSGALTRRSDRLVRMAGEQRLQIHPDDAVTRAIADGDRVALMYLLMYCCRPSPVSDPGVGISGGSYSAGSGSPCRRGAHATAFSDRRNFRHDFSRNRLYSGYG
jgi:formate dehydrogenase major subunit